MNHAILKWYADGMEQMSAPHQDKADGVKGATADKCDMAGDASFYVFSFGFPREFTLQKNNRSWDGSTGDKQKLSTSDIVWQKALASGSLLKVSAEDNRTVYHALHKSKGAGERFSLIFRVIKTFIPVEPKVAADVNDPIYRFVSIAQVKAGVHRPTEAEIKSFAKQQSTFLTVKEQKKRAHDVLALVDAPGPSSAAHVSNEVPVGACHPQNSTACTGEDSEDDGEDIVLHRRKRRKGAVVTSPERESVHVQQVVHDGLPSPALMSEGQLDEDLAPPGAPSSSSGISKVIKLLQKAKSEGKVIPVPTLRPTDYRYYPGYVEPSFAPSGEDRPTGMFAPRRRPKRLMLYRPGPPSSTHQ